MPTHRTHAFKKSTNRHTLPPKEGEIGNSYGTADPDRYKPYNYKWRQAAAAFIRRNPLCEHCKYEDKVTKATEVDHIIPHRGDMDKFWDHANWMALCASHHSKKTYKEGKHERSQKTTT